MLYKVIKEKRVSGNNNADSCWTSLKSVLKNEIIHGKTDPAEAQECDSEEDLDYCVLLLSPHILDTPDAADDSYEPDDK